MDATKTADLTKEYLQKTAEVDYSIKLPDAELDVMRAVWDLTPPVTTNRIMNVLRTQKDWKSPTLISFLTRLEERGYLMSYKNGKERMYIPIAERELYYSSATQQFVESFHGGSLVRLLDSLYYTRSFEETDIDDLLQWLKKRYR